MFPRPDGKGAHDGHQHGPAHACDLRSRRPARGQIALAWLLAKGDDIVPIPGTKRRSFLEENVRAADVSLTPADVAALDAVLPEGKAAGDRYAPELAKLIDR